MRTKEVMKIDIVFDSAQFCRQNFYIFCGVLLINVMFYVRTHFCYWTRCAPQYCLLFYILLTYFWLLMRLPTFKVYL